MCVPVCDPPGRKLTVALRRKGNKRGWWAFFHLTLWNRQIDLAGNISRSRDLCWQAFRIIIQYESFCSDPLHSDAATVYMYHGIMFSSCPSVPFSGTQHLRNTLRKFYQCLIGLEDWTNCILGDEGQRSLWPHKAGFRPWWQLSAKCPIGENDEVMMFYVSANHTCWGLTSLDVQLCCDLVRFRAKTHLVRVWKRSHFDLKYLLWSPQIHSEMKQCLLKRSYFLVATTFKNIHWCPSFKCGKHCGPLSKISSGFTPIRVEMQSLTAVAGLAASLNSTIAHSTSWYGSMVWSL